MAMNSIRMVQGKILLPESLNQLFATLPSDMPSSDYDPDVISLVQWIRWGHKVHAVPSVVIDECAADALLLPDPPSFSVLPPFLQLIAQIDQNLASSWRELSESEQISKYWGWFWDQYFKGEFPVQFEFSSEFFEFMNNPVGGDIPLPHWLYSYILYHDFFGEKGEMGIPPCYRALAIIFRYQQYINFDKYLPEAFRSWLNQPCENYEFYKITRAMELFSCLSEAPISFAALENPVNRIRHIGWIWAMIEKNEVFCPIPVWFINQGLQVCNKLGAESSKYPLSVQAKLLFCSGQLTIADEYFANFIGMYLQSKQFELEAPHAHAFEWIWSSLAKLDDHAVPLPFGLRAIMGSRMEAAGMPFSDSEQQRTAFLCSVILDKKFFSLFFNNDFLAWCNSKYSFPVGNNFLSNLMYRLAFCSDCPVSQEDLSSDDGYFRFITWFNKFVQDNSYNEILPLWFVKHCQSPSTRHAMARKAGLSVGMESYYLQQTGKLVDSDSNLTVLLEITKVVLLADHAQESIFAQPRWSKIELYHCGHLCSPDVSFEGVNLVGATKIVSGIGEDQRSGHFAMCAAGVDHILYDSSNTIKYNSPKQDTVDMGYMSSELRFALSIAYLPAHDAYYLRKNSESIKRSLYYIASSPWELPEYPDTFSFAYAELDEIWAPSRFIFDAFSKAPIPVTLMPLAVEVKPVSYTLRTEFALHPDDFVFLFIFDYNSAVNRKNPWAAIKAFQKAFPKERTDVKFIIKSINGDNHPLLKQELVNITNSDSRFIFYDEAIDRDRLTALMETCDCFVSLHRSEGFGRNIAECMLLKKPVIVSNFSGNLDFTQSDNSFLVSGKLIDIDKNSFIRGVKKGVWFDADIDSAVAQMRNVYINRETAHAVALKGYETVSTRHSYVSVGKLYLEFLHSRGFCLSVSSGS